jgi:hypothetical protein
VGGIAIVSIAVAAIFYLRRRSRASSARSAGFGAFQPRMDGISGPLSDGGTVGLSSPSIRTKFSVRVSRSLRCIMCPHVLPPYFRTPRTCRMTKLRSSGTLVHTRWTTVLQDLHHRTSDQEAICRPHFPRPGNITASPCPLPDLAFKRHRKIEDFGTGQYIMSSFFGFLSL